MIYEFEDQESGEVVGINFPMLEAPGIGDVIERKGRRLRRLAAVPSMRVPADRHFVDHTLPYNYRYHEATGGKFDKEGRCLFDSPAQMRNLEAMANDHGEGIGYTGSGVHPLVAPGTSSATIKASGEVVKK